ncbi:MAG: NFACT family protein [Defluviitaleaceae bacterium]|nr:NFACT family protein [Defluviitaleaceae bacterium]
MPLDGIVISNIAHDIRRAALGGRIDKIYQPEKDEIVANIRSLGSNLKLMLTANSSHPRIHFTNTSKPNPLTAPLFCMVLRKHLGGGKIVSVEQPDFERIIEIGISAQNEMGDDTHKRLIIEIMGKHSNIILVDERGIILDSARHINRETSSVREVLPGLPYVRPPSQGKTSPLLFDETDFLGRLSRAKAQAASDFLVKSYSGISPVAANEVCHRAGIDPNAACHSLDEAMSHSFLDTFAQLVAAIDSNAYTPEIVFKSGKPGDFSSIRLTMFDDLDSYEKTPYDDISAMLEYFYTEKDARLRVDQKTADLRKLVTNNIERCSKKHDTHIRTMREISGREKYKLMGELLTANIYQLEKGMTTFAAQNYYDESLTIIEIELDPNLEPAENAQKHFKRYNKEKRTHAALQEQMTANDQEREYLQALLQTLSTCRDEADIEQVREELSENGYVKKRRKSAKPVRARPLHYLSSDGMDIFVGKNNKQNDELTLRTADNRDIWLHVKDMPGSHVLIKTGGAAPSDTALTEAATLAAYYSKGKSSSNVPVDYTLRKHVRKPSGAKPGMVIYENFKTLFVTPEEEAIKALRTTSI